MDTTALEKQYSPATVEDDIYRFWMEGGYFHTKADPSKKPYTIVMPPPNVTGQLHMGHAADETMQDILIRFKRMQGYAALWVPGTDHASIATEAKVVEALRAEGLTKEALGREGFLRRTWQWKETYGGRICGQLKKLGCSCDWQRERFTMDEGCSDAVRTVFVRLYEQGLIYRGNRMVNWCPKCRTSISDAEVEYAEQEGHFWHLLYPVEETGELLELATTRPETMLGDTAVAINAADERYAHLHGMHVILPLVGRRIPIVCDDHADMTKGTGVVKITPAHDPNDFEVGERHGLPRIRVMTYDGHMTGAADAAAAAEAAAAGRAAEGEPEVMDCGKYAGMTTAEARKAIVADLEAAGALRRTEPLRHDVGSCYRCHTTIEPMVSRQWFVRMEPLARPAIRAVEEGVIRFVPERFAKNYLNWMSNMRDWCISRQLWWGHQIPVWYCDDCGEMTVAKTAPAACPRCGSTHLTQDPDTLDTWFSSALWPFSTLGWPDEDAADLRYFYPTNTLVTGYDIIGFWVSRMIFSGLAHTGKAPFDTVCIHGIVRDEQGRKMSKSLGNGLDPLEVIAQYGADALRLMLVDGSTPGNDMRYSPRKVEAARNFANKLWNAARFVLLRLGDDFQAGLPAPEQLTLADRWILSTLNDTVAAVTDNLEKFEMGLAAAKVQDFIWESYCDWFIEIAKVRLASEDAAEVDTARRVLVYVLDMALRLLHPFMPFITEKLYQALPGHDGALMMQPWPTWAAGLDFPQEREDFGRIVALVKAVRTVRTDMNIHPAKRTHLTVETAVPGAFAAGTAFLQKFAFATDITLIDRFEGDAAGMVQVVTDSARAFIPLAELIDRDKELARLQKELEACRANIASMRARAANESFVTRAPANVVADLRARLAAAESREAGILQSIAALG